MYGYILTYSRLKGRTFKLCVLTRWDFISASAAPHCKGGGGGGSEGKAADVKLLVYL